MFTFQITGYTKSGKTTAATNLIAALKQEGGRVASIKCIHAEDFRMDRPETNTWLHSQAGADPVVALSDRETDFLHKGKFDLAGIVSRISADWLVLEGCSEYPLPRIVCGKDEKEVDDFLDGRTFAIAGVFANDHREYRGLPVFDPRREEDTSRLLALVKEKVFPLLPYVDDDCCRRCGLTCGELAAAIIRGEKTYEDCRIGQHRVRLSIEGLEIPMVDFVGTVLRNNVLSVAKELKGFRPGKITVTVEDEEE